MDKKSPITLVELPPTQYGILDGKPSSDVYSAFQLPSRSIPTLEAVLKHDGWTNVTSINPVYNGLDGKLSAENQRRIRDTKILAVSAITRTAPQSMELVRRCKKENPGVIIIAGGMDPTYRYEEWLEAGTDVVCLGEGENTIRELIQNLYSLKNIKGIATKNGVTERRDLLTPQELDDLPLPIYDAETRAKARVAVVETSRGCSVGCNHCVVTDFYGEKYRKKSTEKVIKLQADVCDIGTSTFYIDDNATLNPKRTIHLLNATINQGLARPGSSAQVTIKAAENPNLLIALQRAGINILYIGIESIFDDSLVDLGKPWSAERTKSAIQRFGEAGFIRHGMMMPGGDKDTPKRLEEILDWSINNLESVQFFAPMPLPGAKLSMEMEKQGRILTKDYSLYDGHNIITRPTNFTPVELQEKIDQMLISFFTKKSIGLEKLPREKRIIGTYFRRRIAEGTFASLKSQQHKDHIEFLRAA